MADAVIRYGHWAESAAAAELHALEVFMGRLIAARGDVRALSPPPGFRLGRGSWGGGRWDHEVWTNGELEAALVGAGWYLRIEQRPGYEGASTNPRRREALVRVGLNPSGIDGEIHVRLALTDSGDTRESLDARLKFTHETEGLLDSMPALLRRDLSQIDSSRRELRNTLQALDDLSNFVPITVDPDWGPRFMRESVMAQVADFVVRLDGGGWPPLPTLAEDAWRWWFGWVLQLSRAAPDSDELSLTDLFEIAGRTVRPDSPAGHREYWKKSLRVRHRGKGAVDRAAELAGIARSTAYDRLRRAGKSVDDFQLEADHVEALASFLTGVADPRQLPRNRRFIVDYLVTQGMKENSARRLERRVREMPPEEQEQKIRKAVERHERGAR